MIVVQVRARSHHRDAGIWHLCTEYIHILRESHKVSFWKQSMANVRLYFRSKYNYISRY